MMEGFDSLTNLQLDALKEIMNIGAGNAATALAQMINRRVSMTVPGVSIVPFGRIHELFADPDELFAAVLLQVTGLAPGSILFMLPRQSADELVRAMLGQTEVSDNNGIRDSALVEMSNIVAQSYLNTLSQFTGLVFQPSVPALGTDMAAALLDTVVVRLGEVGDHVLVLQTMFEQGDVGVAGLFLFVPEPGALDAILSALGVLA